MTTDVRLTSGLTRTVFFIFLWRESIFWGENMGKKMKKPLFSLKTGPLGGSGGSVYAYRTPLVGYICIAASSNPFLRGISVG
jgi:hypothetical protein